MFCVVFQCFSRIFYSSSSRNSSINSTTSPCRHKHEKTMTQWHRDNSGAAVLFQSEVFSTKWITINPHTRSFICDFSYSALLKRLQSVTEWYLPHTACNPGLWLVALMATLPVLQHNNLKKHDATLPPHGCLWYCSLINTGHIVLKVIMWPAWGIQGFPSYTRSQIQTVQSKLWFNGSYAFLFLCMDCILCSLHLT